MMGASHYWPMRSPAASADVLASAPRIFVKKLVVDALDRVDQFADFDPRQHYAPTILSDELTDAEKAAAGRAGGAGTSRTNPDDIEL